MTFDEYQQWCTTKAGDHPDIYWPIGLAGEAGETLDYIKKVVFHGHPLDRNRLRKELGDVLFYTAMTGQKNGISLDGLMWENVHKLNERYPNGFSKERSINRED
jgi:NTP pyrophosphatase (non-canonical NTP hydrolase)